MSPLSEEGQAGVRAAVEERIGTAILLLRGQRIILDADLAALYGVETKTQVQAVRRNPERFPADFAFQPTTQEFAILRSQFVTSSSWEAARDFSAAPLPGTERDAVSDVGGDGTGTPYGLRQATSSIRRSKR